MSGSTPDSRSLADRLRDAVWAEMRDAPYSNWSYRELPTRAKARVDRTLAAVLRTLERYAIEETDENSLHALDLDELAVVVEKGEHT